MYLLCLDVNFFEYLEGANFGNFDFHLHFA